jgi:hypothetical protein
MKGLDLGEVKQGRPLNAVVLHKAVLCADCDVVSDRPHDRCLVCGSRSLINISRMLGGSLPESRANVIEAATAKPECQRLVLSIRRSHKIRRRLTA